MSTTPVLHGYVPLGPFCDMSPFVTKVESYLKLAGVEYEKRQTLPTFVPRAKLPYLEHANSKVPDSTKILTYLEDAGIANHDDWLDDDQRAELSAIISMLELELYFIVVYFRWQWEPGYRSYKPIPCDFLNRVGIPGFLTGLTCFYFRRALMSSLHGQGSGRREADENLARAREIYAAHDRFLARHEGKGDWWFGPKPSSADIIAHAFLGHASYSGLDTPMEGMMDEFPRLLRWYEHVDGQLSARS